MLQRDYIMRLLREFVEALTKLVDERKEEDVPVFQLKLNSFYRAYFNHAPEFYYEQEPEFILNNLQQTYEGPEFLVRIEMLSEILHQDGMLKEPAEQKYLLVKALYLLEYLDTHSDTFSFERRDKINGIKKIIEV